MLLKNRPLALGFAAVAVPLLLVLGLQLWWLLRLHRTSIAAGRAVLTGFLDAVATDVVYSYGPAAERALDVPASLFAQDRLEKASAHFRKRDVLGVKTLFVARFSSEGWGTLLLYDPESDTMRPAGASDETRAITVACAPWKLMHERAIQLDSPRLFVEEREPENRIVLNPITDASARVLGVAGMVLDSRWFVAKLLPGAFAAQMPKFFPEGEEAVATLRDGTGSLRFSTDPADERPDEVARPLEFVFTDMRIGVRSRDLSPEQLARLSLGFNLTLSLAAAALLAGGLAFLLRTAAREVRLSEMKSDFVSNVSHELRTPLASIRTFGELLRHGRATTPEKVREYGGYIETEGRRLTQIVENLLDFARIESGRKVYRSAPTSVAAAMRTALGTLENRLRDGGFEVETRGLDEPLPEIPADEDALTLAFHNLLDNAVKYSGASRWIGVGIERRGSEIVASVRDRGIGIPPEEQARIFDRFHRVGTGLVHDVRGAGLGLAIVRHVAEAHGGRATVESAPGQGSVFAIRLPIPPGAERGSGQDPPGDERRERR